MGRVPDVSTAVERHGFSNVGHFTLSDEALWDGSCAPMQRRIEALRRKDLADGEALAVLDPFAKEPAAHRLHSSFHAYEFFVARRGGQLR